MCLKTSAHDCEKHSILTEESVIVCSCNLCNKGGRVKRIWRRNPIVYGQTSVGDAHLVSQLDVVTLLTSGCRFTRLHCVLIWVESSLSSLSHEQRLPLELPHSDLSLSSTFLWAPCEEPREGNELLWKLSVPQYSHTFSPLICFSRNSSFGCK